MRSAQTQTVPAGQQTGPELVAQITTPAVGQTQRPSRQTVPSGQQTTLVVPGTRQTFLFLQQAPLTQIVPSGQQRRFEAGPQRVEPVGQTQTPSRQTNPSGQQNTWPPRRQTRGRGQHLPLMQTVPVGQQIAVAPGTAQVVVPGGQTHLPFRQTMPGGQQKRPFGPVHTWELGQQRPLMQTVPAGQQTNPPVADVGHVVVPVGQTHLPSTQTVPSGQQKDPLADTQTRGRGQHAPLMQTLPSGQQTSPPVSGFVQTVVPGAQTHCPFTQMVFAGQQKGAAVGETRQMRLVGQQRRLPVWAWAFLGAPRPMTTIPERRPATCRSIVRREVAVARIFENSSK